MDSGASHCFVLEQLVAHFGLPVVSVEGMEVMLADRTYVSALHTCLVPLIVCADRGIVLHTVVHCHVLPSLNHDAVLGTDWLRASNPVIDWQACTLSVECAEHQGAVTLHALPTATVAKVELCSIK